MCPSCRITSSGAAQDAQPRSEKHGQSEAPPPEFLVSHVLKPGQSDGRMVAKSLRTGRTSRSASLGRQSSRLKMD